MIRTVTRASAGLLLAVACSVPFWNPARSAPVPKEVPDFRLKLAGTITIPDLHIDDAAIIDESKVVVVGTVEEQDGDNVDKIKPNGAILDLAKKDHRPFTNDHTHRIVTVSVSRNRIVTAGNSRDPHLRVWDLKADKSIAEIQIGFPGATQSTHFSAACFHNDDRIAVAADGKIVVLDPLKPDDRTEYEYPDEACWQNNKPAVSHDDTMIANGPSSGGIACWNVATKKSKSLNMKTEMDAKEKEWHSSEVLFGRKGMALAWGCAVDGEVAENGSEADVPAERRGIVRLDLAKGTLTPLKMGLAISTLACAVDPTETWLATGGSSWKDKPIQDNKKSSELRVYHLPTGTLVHREQLEGIPLSWVAFTPSGKRIVAKTSDGVVRWWDVEGK